jgi:multiple sugar transport system substrate-binding protein
MNRALRTALAAIAAVLTIAALAACGSSGSAKKDDSGNQRVELTFWTHTHPPMIELNKTLIEEYEAKHPNVTIKYEQIPNTEFGTKMLTALSNGSGPDIINMDDSALRGEYIPKNLLAPIDPAAFGKGSAKEIEAGYVPGTLDGAKGKDGKLYGVPTEFNATAFAINKAHFADAGLDPATPRRGTRSPRTARGSSPRATRDSTSSTCTPGGTRRSFRRCSTRPADRS